MGLFSSIGSFVSGVCSAIGSVVSAVGSALTAAGSALASGLMGICSAIGSSSLSSIVASIIGPVLTIPSPLLVIAAVVGIIAAVANMLGVKEKDEKPEELGMKAEQAEKKPEDFDSTKEYIEYLRKEVKVDKEKLENLSEEDKQKYAVVGASLYIKDMQERYKIEMPGEFWHKVNEVGMKNEEVKALIDECKKNGLDNLKDVCDVLEGKAPSSGLETDVLSSGIKEAIKSVYPEMTEKQIEEKLDSIYN